MLIDELMPRYDVMEHHEVDVAAPAGRVYETVRELDLGRSALAVVLFAVRGIPHLLRRKVPLQRRLDLDFLRAAGFVVLGEIPDEELVLGAIGRFWRLDSGIERVASQDFADFDQPGFAKAALNFHVQDLGAHRTRVATETRVVCTDARARRRFGAYWRLIGPFSSLLRGVVLRQIKNAAERDVSRRGH